MKKLTFYLCVVCCILFGSFAFADENQNTTLNPTETIVGQELLNNRFEYVDPTKPQEQRPQAVQELLDQGVFTAIQDAKTGGGQVVNGGASPVVKQFGYQLIIKKQKQKQEVKQKRKMKGTNK